MRSYLALFFTEPQILAIAEDRLAGVLSEAEQAVVRFSRQIARDASAISAAQVVALEAHGYAAAEIFDIAATAAGRAFFTKLLDALGVLPDSPFLAGDDAFRRALTVGRAIDDAPCETLPLDAGDNEWQSGETG